jgi:hypothetical protein
MEDMSKDYSWAYVDVSRKLSDGPCELVFAYLVPSAATTDTVLYNGRNAQGGVITTLKVAVVTGHKFKPPVPVYCEKGLYIAVGTSVSGVFVQWRNL